MWAGKDFFLSSYIQGVPKTRKLLKSLIVKIECPIKKVHVLKFS